MRDRTFEMASSHVPGAGRELAGWLR